MLLLMNWRMTVSWIWRLSLCLVVVGVGYVGVRALGLATKSPDAIWKQAEADLRNGG